jgi:hypothetical protein
VNTVVEMGQRKRAVQRGAGSWARGTIASRYYLAVVRQNVDQAQRVSDREDPFFTLVVDLPSAVREKEIKELT